MRIGYCTNLIATQADGTGREWIEEGKECGFDYVELPLAQMMDLNDREFSSLKERVDSSRKEGVAPWSRTVDRSFPG